MGVCSFPKCGKPLGWSGLFCNGHRSQQQRGLTLTPLRYRRAPGDPPVIEFDVAANGCHIFRGRLNDGGYGVVCIDGDDVGVNRYLWALKHGEIPAGLQVLHSCDNPPCINQAHHFLGTIADNMADKVAKGRHPMGERHYLSKLTTAGVRELRRRRAAGESVQSLSGEFGVNESVVSQVATGKSWKHVV